MRHGLGILHRQPPSFRFFSFCFPAFFFFLFCLSDGLSLIGRLASNRTIDSTRADINFEEPKNPEARKQVKEGIPWRGGAVRGLAFGVGFAIWTQAGLTPRKFLEKNIFWHVTGGSFFFFFRGGNWWSLPWGCVRVAPRERNSGCVPAAHLILVKRFKSPVVIMEITVSSAGARSKLGP